MTLSVFFAVIILLAIGFVVLYVLSIYLKYRKSSYKDANLSGLRYLHSCNIVLHSVKTGLQSPVLRPPRRPYLSRKYSEEKGRSETPLELVCYCSIPH